jgi:hypothetical protein
MMMFLHRRYVITVAFVGRYLRQNRAHDGGEPVDW